MMIPTIHMNGTPKIVLMGEYKHAHEAVDAAIVALENVTVHGRDYYPQGTFAFSRAAAEHIARGVRLRAVRDELREIYYGIADQK